MINILIHKDFVGAAAREYKHLKSELRNSTVFDPNDIKFYDDKLFIDVAGDVYIRFVVDDKNPFKGYKHFMYKTDSSEFIQATYGDLDDCMEIESERELYEGIIFLYGAKKYSEFVNGGLDLFHIEKGDKGDES